MIITKGDTITLPLSLKFKTNDGLEAAVLNGSDTVKLGIKTTSGVTEFTCSITDASKGKVKCDLSAANTATLIKGDEQSFYVEVTTTDNKRTSFRFEKAISVREQEQL